MPITKSQHSNKASSLVGIRFLLVLCSIWRPQPDWSQCGDGCRSSPARPMIGPLLPSIPPRTPLRSTPYMFLAWIVGEGKKGFPSLPRLPPLRGLATFPTRPTCIFEMKPSVLLYQKTIDYLPSALKEWSGLSYSLSSHSTTITHLLSHQYLHKPSLKRR